MIKSSKGKDIKRNQYDADHHIDKFFIKQLIETSTKCHYCEVQMQFTQYTNDLCTIERLNNNIGHIKSNCVLACRKCNFSRVGDGETIYCECGSVIKEAKYNKHKTTKCHQDYIDRLYRKILKQYN